MKKRNSQSIIVIGAGSMGTALIEGFIRSKQLRPGQITALDNNRKRLRSIRRQYPVVTTVDYSHVAGHSAIIFAVKPQQMRSAVSSVKNYVHPRHLVLSIAAGISTDFLGKLIGQSLPIIRAMPNTPALIRQGAIGIAAGRYAKKMHMQYATKLLSSVGLVVSVSERLINAVTAISGSGPAYVFFLAEAMINAGKQMGLSDDIASQLTIQTLYGSSRLMQDTKLPPKHCRQQVTSPGGTTEAALMIMEKGSVQKTLIKAFHRANKRACEIAKKIQGK
ncbi:MAG: pyrroline-5-carboxylate reductase [Elusimicrobia bacterium]|nr:pyrroline-5-carboxylate reductase [Elusimicrobiota bacterium]MBD3412329.1 pyrroline-5-carboxylate reductase [Elusimicrobiota bacterium]